LYIIHSINPDIPLVSLNVVSTHQTGYTWTYEYKCLGKRTGARGETQLFPSVS